MNSINDGFEHGKPLGRQADAGSDDDTIIGLRSQQTLDCRTSAFIRPDEANLALPSTFRELLQRNREFCSRYRHYTGISRAEPLAS